MTISDGRVRIDKWLWAARFFKTRGLAKEAVIGGKVRLEGQTLKPSFQPSIDDVLTIRRGQEVYEIVIVKLSDKRQSAAIAQLLYCETEQSKAKREMIRTANQAKPTFEQKPDKKQRRQIRDLQSRSL